MTTAKLALIEVFAAPQGEGYNAGRWAVFVRLAGCPLACEFASGVVCDTPYRGPNFKVTVDELFNEIVPQHTVEFLDAPLHEQPMLIFTGGEPTAQPLFDAAMRHAYSKTHFYIAVETNGMYWRTGLNFAHWISVSPKYDVPQTSTAAKHNPHPKTPFLDPLVMNEMERRWLFKTSGARAGGEYRYVITATSRTPSYHHAPLHYLSPAVLSDGSGLEWKTGFPGFAPGAVERCLEIVREDPRWRISTQQHKLWGVR